MSVIDKFLDVMKLGGDGYEDEYDDYDDFDDDYEDEKPRKKLFGRRGDDDNDEEEAPAKAKPQKVTPIRQASRKQGNGMEVCVIKPSSFDDAREVTETLLSNRTVVLNFEGLDVDVAQRIIDVTSGTCFAIGGNLKKVSASIFIVTPKNVDISGDLQDILSGAIDIPSVYSSKLCSFGVQQQALRMMTKEEQQLEKRFLELGEQAWQRGTAVYSDFLNLNELNIFQEVRPKLPHLETESFGGYELAERQIAVFRPEAPLFCTEPPIACLRITPLQEKFAEALTHRDYLGAVLNLGLQRSCLGDILVEDRQAYLFCLTRIAPFICDSLTRVRHTTVSVSMVEAADFHYEPRYREITGTVASVRLDRLLSLAFGASRSSLTGLIEGGKVFVNGKLVTSNGYQPREGDLISVRGMGRFRYQGGGGQSKKGREYVTLLRYI